MRKDNKFKIQDNQYTKPYHHFLDLKNCKFFEVLSWGLKYYSYVSFTIEYFDRIKSNKKIKNVAEVGCGDGKILYELAKRYQDINFEGYDLSKRAILFAKAFSFGLDNIEFFDYDFKYANKRYDLILCIETLEHIPDKDIQKFLKTIHNNLNSDGILILSVPTTNLKLHPKHYKHYNKEILQSSVKDYFNIKELYYLHNFKSLKTRILNAILFNPFFILNFRLFRKYLFRYYHKNLRIANEATSAHLFAVLEKK